MSTHNLKQSTLVTQEVEKFMISSTLQRDGTQDWSPIMVLRDPSRKHRAQRGKNDSTNLEEIENSRTGAPACGVTS